MRRVSAALGVAALATASLVAAAVSSGAGTQESESFAFTGTDDEFLVPECVTELTVEVEKTVTIAEVNAAFNAAASGPMKGILAVSTEELVSSDYIGNPHSCILDSLSTNVVDGTMVKVSGWYDNEWGYANRCVDLIRMIGQ